MFQDDNDGEELIQDEQTSVVWFIATNFLIKIYIFNSLFLCNSLNIDFSIEFLQNSQKVVKQFKKSKVTRNNIDWRLISLYKKLHEENYEKKQ